MLGFADIKTLESPSGIDPSPASAKTYLRSTITQGLDLHRRSTERWCLRKNELRTEAAILGRGGGRARNALASNMALRKSVGGRGIDLFHAFAKEDTSRRFAHVTLISDRWLAFDCDTFIFLGGMVAAARTVLEAGGFDGWLAVAEVQTLDESVRGLGRILLPNVHATVWSRDPNLSFAQVERKLRALPALVSRIGAPTVTIERRSDTSPTNLFAYQSKNAAVAKHRVPCRHTDSGFKLKDCPLRPASAVRQHEILSGIYLNELIFGGGEGVPIEEALHRLIETHHPARPSGLSADAALHFWNKMRRRHGRDEHFYPVAIDRTDAQLPVESGISLAAARFTRAPTSAPEETG